MKNNDLWEVYCEFCNQLVPKVSNNKDKSEFLRMAREGISMDGKVVNYNTYGLTLNILGFNVFLPSSLIAPGSYRTYRTFYAYPKWIPSHCMNLIKMNKIFSVKIIGFDFIRGNFICSCYTSENLEKIRRRKMNIEQINRNRRIAQEKRIRSKYNYGTESINDVYRDTIRQLEDAGSDQTNWR